MKSIKKEQKVFKDFVQSAVEPILFANEDGKIVFFNTGCTHFFGFSEEEISDLSLYSLIEKSSLQNFYSILEQVKKGRTLCFEIPCITKDNRIIETEITAGLSKSGEGMLIYFFFRDISNIKEIKNRLRHFDSFSETSPDFIIEWDKHQGIVYFNQAVKDFMSIPGNEGKNGKGEKCDVARILPVSYEDYARDLAGTNRSLRGIEAVYENRVFSYTFTPFKHADTRVLLVGKDITPEYKLKSERDHTCRFAGDTINFIENILKEIRLIDLNQDIDLKPIAMLYLREDTDIFSFSPTHILIALENDEYKLEGNLYFRNRGEVEKTPEFLLNANDMKKLIPPRGEMILANCPGEEKKRDCFMRWFPRVITDQIPEIRNFASYRIVGERDGVFIALNYEEDVSTFNGEAIRSLAVAVGTLLSIHSKFKAKEESQFLTMLKMAEVAEKRDMETGEHLKRIQNYARIIAEELAKLPKYQKIITTDYIQNLYNSAAMHDIGKVGIPDSVLQKPGKLTHEEFETMREHPLIGGKLLEGPRSLDMAREIAYYHHEKYDGSGYPMGLKGEDIPLSARIVALVDVYDAMTSARVYKEPLSHDKTKKLISICSGGHFDPDVVDAFLAREQDFIRIKTTFR